MFAVDTMDRFIVMFTFSDGKAPLALKGLKEANFVVEKYLKFNNSAIFEAIKDFSSVDRTTLNFF